MSYGGSQKLQKVMVQPINLIFRFLQNRTMMSLWLYENVNTRIEGIITGFNEYMNLVLRNLSIYLKSHTRNPLRRSMKPRDGAKQKYLLPLTHSPTPQHFQSLFYHHIHLFSAPIFSFFPLQEWNSLFVL